MTRPLTHRRNSIIDSRGCAIPLFRQGGSAMSADLSAETARRIQMQATRGEFGRWRWRAALLAALALAHTGVVLSISRHVSAPLGWAAADGLRSVVFPAVAAGSLFLMIWGAIRFEHALMRRRRSRSLLSECICPACLYPLTGLPERSDRCTICPECGGAWRVQHEAG